MQTGRENFDISHHMTDLQMDHICLAETGRHWPSLKEDDRIPHRFRGHFMSHRLDSTVAYNKHDLLSVSYQFGGTASLAPGNQSYREIGSDSDTTGIGIWSWKIFRGQGNSTLRIATVYMTCSSPRCPVRSHSLVCSENPFSIVGIGPIPVKEL